MHVSGSCLKYSKVSKAWLMALFLINIQQLLTVWCSFQCLSEFLLTLQANQANLNISMFLLQSWWWGQTMKPRRSYYLPLWAVEDSIWTAPISSAVHQNSFDSNWFNVLLNVSGISVQLSNSILKSQSQSHEHIHLTSTLYMCTAHFILA